MNLTNKVDDLPLGIIIDVDYSLLCSLAADVPSIFVMVYGEKALLEYILSILINKEGDDNEIWPEYNVSYS